LKVAWGRAAIADIDALFLFVAADNPAAAERESNRILEAAEALGTHAAMGRPGRVAGTRELIVPPYIVAYRVKGENVQVLRVLHSAHQWPDAL